MSEFAEMAWTAQGLVKLGSHLTLTKTDDSRGHTKRAEVFQELFKLDHEKDFGGRKDDG